jgi:phosphoserine phosphatase
MPTLEAVLSQMPCHRFLSVGSAEELLDLLPRLRPEDHTVVVNNTHPLVGGGGTDQFGRLVREARGLVADFDGTLHAGNQWAQVRELLTPEDRRADEADAACYFADPAAGNEIHAAFILETVARLSRSRQGLHRVEELSGKLSPRPGVMVLFRSFSFNRSAIVSFGLYNVIRNWVWRYGLNAEAVSTTIFALQLEWDGTRCSPNLGTIVSDGNKGYCRQVFCGARQLASERTLVIGDSPTDIFMMGPDVPGVFLIPRIDPQPGRMAHRMARVAEMWDRVACVLVSDSLEPLVEMRMRK